MYPAPVAQGDFRRIAPVAAGVNKQKILTFVNIPVDMRHAMCIIAHITHERRMYTQRQGEQ